MDYDEVRDRRRALLDAEMQFIREPDGQRWIRTYVTPYYLDWMRYGPAHAGAVAPLIPAVRDRAAELSAADISRMLRMHWRVQVMGTWYAVARADELFTEPLHDAFDFCYGSLTSPGLTAAVLTYRGDATARVLRAYRERAIAGKHGDTDLITTALRRLEPDPTGPARIEEGDVLDRLLDTARQLQAHGI